MGIGEKILANLIQQNPTRSLVAACNAYINWVNSNIIMESVCLINNDECNNESKKSNKAIDSHLVSKGANLKPIAKNGKVRAVGVNHKNPLNSKIKETAIKKATTFPGFCKYHDNLLFSALEIKKIEHYTREHAFLLCLRVVAYKKYCSEKRYKEANFVLHSFKNKIVRNMIKESSAHNLMIDSILHGKRKSKYREIWNLIKTTVEFKHNLKSSYKIAYEDYIAFSKLSECLKTILNKKDYARIEFRQYTINNKKIAFSSAYNIPYKKNNMFLFLFVLPNDVGSNILIACLKKDYKILIRDNYIKGCFDGNIDNIQHLINLDSDCIIFNGDDFEDYEYAKYIYESDNQIIDLFPPNILK